MAGALIDRARRRMVLLHYRAGIRRVRSLDCLSECRIRQDHAGVRRHLLDFHAHDHVAGVMDAELRTQYRELRASRAGRSDAVQPTQEKVQ